MSKNCHFFVILLKKWQFLAPSFWQFFDSQMAIFRRVRLNLYWAANKFCLTCHSSPHPHPAVSPTHKSISSSLVNCRLLWPRSLRCRWQILWHLWCYEITALLINLYFWPFSRLQIQLSMVSFFYQRNYFNYFSMFRSFTFKKNILE